MLADSSRSQLLRGSIIRFHFTPLSLTSNSDTGEQARAAISSSPLGINHTEDFAVASKLLPLCSNFQKTNSYHQSEVTE